MLIKQDGRYMIAFPEGTTLSDIAHATHSIIDLLQYVTQETDTRQEHEYWLLELLRNLMLTPVQMETLERDPHFFE